MTWMMMWLNRSVATLIATLQLFDIYRYMYIYIYIYFDLLVIVLTLQSIFQNETLNFLKCF